ncbi:DNA-binding protein [Actinomadura montaniterrae]|uniref:DNA-binding protein n=1 Tax=Actinomadura montaniterrae TaxID=1803903 RepID=A0A6L3VK09_9ACTN|nr:DNA-binding protein [Actinomadura montaniterrae]
MAAQAPLQDLRTARPFSRSRIYELVRAGRIRTVTEHSVRLVPASAIVEYIELLEREARAA